MKTSIIDQISEQLEFFQKGVVLQSEKEQVFQTNSELTHDSAYDVHSKNYNSNLHPQFDPVTSNPVRDFFIGLPVDTKKVNFEQLKNENVKLHIALVKPKFSTKGTRRWMLAGNRIFSTFSSDGKNFNYLCATDVRMLGRFLTIRTLNNTYKFTLKTPKKSMDNELVQYFTKVYSTKSSQTFEWFFSSIKETDGFPPVIQQTLGFYKSIVEHMQFLYIFASLMTENTLKNEVVDAWISCAYSSLPTLIPCLLQNYLRTEKDDEIFKKCFATKAILVLIERDPGISKHMGGASAASDIIESFHDKSKLKPVTRYAMFLLFNEFYRKFNDLEKCSEIFIMLMNEIHGTPFDPASIDKAKVQRIVTKYSAFPEEFRVFVGSNETNEQIKTILDAIYAEKENYSELSSKIDLQKTIGYLELIFASGFVAIPAPEETQTQTVTKNIETIEEEESYSESEPKKLSFKPAAKAAQLPRPPSLKNSTASLPPNASTNNMYTSEQAQSKLAPPPKKDEEAKKEKKSSINHIPNYTVDESEEGTEYSFESQTSEPIIIPPKPMTQPNRFESDSEDKLPPQRSSPLKPPTKEQLEKVIGKEPLVSSPLPVMLPSDQKNEQKGIPPVNSVNTLLSDDDQNDKAHSEDDQKELDFSQEKKETSTESRPIMLAELRQPKQIKEYSYEEEEEEEEKKESATTPNSKTVNVEEDEDEKEKSKDSSEFPTINEYDAEEEEEAKNKEEKSDDTSKEKEESKNEQDEKSKSNSEEKDSTKNEQDEKSKSNSEEKDSTKNEQDEKDSTKSEQDENSTTKSEEYSKSEKDTSKNEQEVKNPTKSGDYSYSDDYSKSEKDTSKSEKEENSTPKSEEKEVKSPTKSEEYSKSEKDEKDTSKNEQEIKNPTKSEDYSYSNDYSKSEKDEKDTSKNEEKENNAPKNEEKEVKSTTKSDDYSYSDDYSKNEQDEKEEKKATKSEEKEKSTTKSDDYSYSDDYSKNEQDKETQSETENVSTQSKTVSVSIRSAADLPNLESLDTNTMSPNIYTEDTEEEEDDN